MFSPDAMFYKDHVKSNSEKIHKATLHKSKNILLGLNCLVPGQVQTIHAHEGQDKFYYVIEGEGVFIIGDEKKTYGTGHIVWASAGAVHGVSNQGNEDLILLVGITPSP